MLDETPDYPALHRIWPMREWFRFAGRTQRIREQQAARRAARGPHGSVIDAMGRIYADACIGEINA